MKYFVFLFLVSLNICGQELNGLNVSKFEAALKENTVHTLLDIRSEKLFQRGHIKKAINLDYNDVAFEKRVYDLLDKKKDIFLYSSTTNEAKNATLFLKDLGFNKVYYLEDGFGKWTASSKPYVSLRIDSKPIAAYTLENFYGIINGENKVFVFLSAPWCSHCKIMEPIVRKHTGVRTGIKLLKIDASKELAITEHFKVNNTPTLLYFKNGKQVWRYSGEIEESTLQKVLFN